jgi:IS5 family transposase
MMGKTGQMSFADMEISQNRKASRVGIKLDKINSIVDWDKVLELVKIVDRTDEVKGGCPHKDLLIKVKMLFLQSLYNLSDPELEDQVNDRLSFQYFVGLDMSVTVPDYSTIWRFRERLSEEGIGGKLFNLINSFLEAKGLFVKKGTIVDASIIESTNRPLSKERRKELEKNPSPQVDTDAHSTVKRGKKYFGYKGHIGTDVCSKLIRKRRMTSAQPHDSQVTGDLLTGDEAAVFGDSAYSNKEDKRKARKEGIYYGMLDKGTRRKGLSASQKKRNKKKSKVRSAVEHPFGYMKEKLGYKKCVAKNLRRNSFYFDMNCILYNIFRADYLLSAG